MYTVHRVMSGLELRNDFFLSGGLVASAGGTDATVDSIWPTQISQVHFLEAVAPL